MSVSPYEFLIREIRLARTEAGLTQDVVGERIHFSPQKVSAVETGRAPLTNELVAALDEALAVGGRFTRMWEDLVRDAAAPTWLREWIEIEREATAFRWYEHAFVPGLLQTEAYARAIFRASGFPASQVDSLVQARLDRKTVFMREPTPQLFVVLDEMAVYRECGSPDAMAEQIAHLIDCAAQPHIQLNVVPRNLGIYAGLAGAFILADLPEGGRAGYVDNQLSAQVIEQPETIAKLALAWDTIRGNALPHGLTLDLLAEAAKAWT